MAPDESDGSPITIRRSMLTGPSASTRRATSEPRPSSSMVTTRRPAGGTSRSVAVGDSPSVPPSRDRKVTRTGVLPDGLATTIDWSGDDAAMTAESMSSGAPNIRSKPGRPVVSSPSMMRSTTTGTSLTETTRAPWRRTFSPSAAPRAVPMRSSSWTATSW